MVDDAVTARKIAALRDHVDRIRQVLPPRVEAYLGDRSTQEIVAFNLIQAVQALIDLAARAIGAEGLAVPDTLGGIFSLLGQRGVLPADLAERLCRAVGMRNLLVHEYGGIDHALVHEVAARDLDDLLRGAERIARHAGMSGGPESSENGSGRA